jgi:hypothetical protein
VAKLSQSELDAVSIKHLILAELDVGPALRIVLALLFRILRTRIDRGTLSALKASRLREDAVRLVKELASDEAADESSAAPATVEPPAPDFEATAPAATQIVGPPLVQTQAADVMEVAEVAPQDLAGLTVDELQTFVRSASPDVRPVFEAALHVEYRKSLVQLFGSPVTLKRESDGPNGARLRILQPVEFACVLPDGMDALLARHPSKFTEANLSKSICDIFEMWKAEQRPDHFRISLESTSELFS